MARTRRHGGLITLGIVLTVILTIASGFDIRLQGGVGDRIERPTTSEEVRFEYNLSIGQLTIDLRGVDFTGTIQEMHASVGIGQLTVRVPRGITAVHVEGHAGAGRVMLLGRESSGVDVDLSVPSKPWPQFLYPHNGSLLVMHLSVGLGQIEVTQ